MTQATYFVMEFHGTATPISAARSPIGRSIKPKMADRRSSALLRRSVGNWSWPIIRPWQRQSRPEAQQAHGKHGLSRKSCLGLLLGKISVVNQRGK